MKYKVNLHITERCNYHCRYCFAKYSGNDMGFPEWKAVIGNLVGSGMVSAVNFAGGEPLLHPDFREILDYAYNKGLVVSFITNGSLFVDSNKFLPKDAAKVSCIGISVDSFDSAICSAVGRCGSDGKKLDFGKVAWFIGECRRQNPDVMIKVNTVVSKWNKDERIADFICLLGWNYGWGVNKWKILRAMPFGGDSSYCITDEQFNSYAAYAFHTCRSNKAMKVVVEHSLENAYVIVDNRGNLISNIGGVNVSCGSLLEKPFGELMKNYPLDFGRYLEHSRSAF